MKAHKACPGTVLYKFESADRRQKGYLFGTMHVSDRAAFQYYDLAISYLQECRLVATEVDLDLGSSYNLAEMLKMKNGLTLQSFYTAKQYDKMTKVFQKHFGIDLRAVNNYVPFFVVNMVGEYELMRQGQQPLDLAIWNAAIERGIDRIGLEDFLEHYQVLSRIPLKDQAQQLLKLSKNITKFRRGILNVKHHYVNGDLRMLYKIAKQSLGTMKKIMLYDRNFIIAESCMRLSKEHKLFAAMGASHLWGNTGVIALMKRHNFKLKPIFIAS